MRFPTFLGVLTVAWSLYVAPGSSLAANPEVPCTFQTPTEPGAASIVEAADIVLIDVRWPPGSPGARRDSQPVEGQFFVHPDGTINLGLYGAVIVAGRTPRQAGDAIRDVLARAAPGESERQSADGAPAVTVQVMSYGPNCFSVTIVGPQPAGEQIFRFPLKGSETVLDVAGKLVPKIARPVREMWVVRGSGKNARTLPVDWRGITQHGMTATNYAIEPGDRVFIRCAGPAARQAGK